MSEAASATTMGVAICCSYADLGLAQELKMLLADAGVEAELVPDVDRDDDALVMQLLGDRASTVYVLLATAAFDPDRVQTLVQEFGARRRPTHRLQIVEPLDDDLDRTVEQVVHAVRTSAKRASRVDLPAVGGGTQRGLREAPRRETTQRPQRRAKSRRAPEDPNPLRDHVGAIPASIRTFGSAPSPGAVQRRVRDDITRRLPGTRAEEPAPPSRPLREPVITRREVTVPAAESIPPEVDPVEEQLAALDHEDVTPPPPVADVDPAGTTAARPPPSRVGTFLIGVVATAAVAALAWVYLGGDRSEGPRVAVAPASAGGEVAEPAPTSSKPAVVAPAPAPEVGADPKPEESDPTPSLQPTPSPPKSLARPRRRPIRRGHSTTTGPRQSLVHPRPEPSGSLRPSTRGESGRSTTCCSSARGRRSTFRFRRPSRFVARLASTGSAAGGSPRSWSYADSGRRESFPVRARSGPAPTPRTRRSKASRCGPSREHPTDRPRWLPPNRALKPSAFASARPRFRASPRR